MFNKADEIDQVIDKYPECAGRIGQIPKEFSHGITDFESKLAKAINDYKNELYLDLKSNLENLNTGLRNKFEIKKARAQGTMSEVCYLERNGIKVALKVYYKKAEKFYPYVHGAKMEANKAAFIANITQNKSQFAPFYYADLKNDFMICKYVDVNSEPPEKIIIPEHYGLKLTSDGIHENNRVYNKDRSGYYIFDYGTSVPINHTLSKNPTVRSIYSNILESNDINSSWKKEFKALQGYFNTQKALALIISLKYTQLEDKETQNFYKFVLSKAKQNNDIYRELTLGLFDQKQSIRRTLLDMILENPPNLSPESKKLSGKLGYKMEVPKDNLDKALICSNTESFDDALKLLILYNLDMLEPKEYKNFTENIVSPDSNFALKFALASNLHLLDNPTEIESYYKRLAVLSGLISPGKGHQKSKYDQKMSLALNQVPFLIEDKYSYNTIKNQVYRELGSNLWHLLNNESDF